MNREILFRGKRISGGEWVNGYMLVSDDDCYIIPDFGVSCVEKLNNYVCDNLITLHAFEVDKDTICQYTGLKDVNEKMIFEGDIVKTSQYGVCDGNGHNYAGFDTFSIEFSDGGFCLKNKWRRFNLRPLRDFEVIGNIFDNPELLEGVTAK